MVHIYSRKRNKNRYYALRISIRKGKKVTTKNIGYLGKNISFGDISKIQESYKKYIKKPKSFRNKIIKEIYKRKYENETSKENKYFNQKQLSGINAIINHYKNQFKKTNKKTKEKIFKKTRIRFMKSNISIDIIERKYPSFKETEKFIEYKEISKKLSLVQIYSLDNTNKVLEYLKKEEPKLNLSVIEEVSNLIWGKIITNQFKSSKVKITLKNLIKWFGQNKSKIHPLALVILFHHKFEKMRPFLQGNGEIGRIIMNYQLSQFNYPPIIIPYSKKQEYFNVLNQADKAVKKDLLSTDMRYYYPLMDFMQKCFVKTYWDNFVV